MQKTIKTTDSKQRGSNHSRVAKGTKILLVSKELGAVKSIYTMVPWFNDTTGKLHYRKEWGITRHDCYKKTIIDSDQVEKMIDPNDPPAFFANVKKISIWKGMSDRERLQYYLSRMCEENYRYELIE